MVNVLWLNFCYVSDKLWAMKVDRGEDEGAVLLTFWKITHCVASSVGPCPFNSKIYRGGSSLKKKKKIIVAISSPMISSTRGGLRADRGGRNHPVSNLFSCLFLEF